MSNNPITNGMRTPFERALAAAPDLSQQIIKTAVDSFIERRDLLVMYVATVTANARPRDLIGRLEIVEYPTRPGEADYYLMDEPRRPGDKIEGHHRQLIATIIMDRPTVMQSHQDVHGMLTLPMRYSTILGDKLPQDIVDGTAPEIQRLRLELAELGLLYGMPIPGTFDASNALREAGNRARLDHARRSPLDFERDYMQEPPIDGPNNK